MTAYDVVDADGHILEPPDMWARYIDPEFRDRAPRVVEDQGVDVFSIGDKEIKRGLGRLGAHGQRDGKVFPDDMRYLDGEPGGFDPHARVRVLDAQGIDAAVLYPTLMTFAGLIEDPAFAAAVCRAYNRYIADFCSEHPDRLIGVATIPVQSIEVAVDELVYATEELGLTRVFIRPNPYMGRILSDAAYDDFWAAAQERDVSIALHEGTGGMPAAGVDRVPPGRAAAHIVSHSVEMMLASLNLLWGGVCDRFPDLRFGFLECGGGWMAGWLDRMDRHFDDAMFRASGGPKTRPSEAFARQCWISFEPAEQSLPYLLEFLGPTKILWATDYPHPDSFTDAPKMMRELVPETHRQSVLAQGAIDFYRLR